MYHSITFEFEEGGVRNTWEHWRLIPTSRPGFAPPKTKTKYISVPGSDTDIDMTEAIKGYPVYQNRTGSFEFIVDNMGTTQTRAETHEFWYWDMLTFLNGKRAKAILEDDPCHYYEGRFSVSGYSPESHWNKVTIGYDVAPYKLRITSTVEPWLWDPFNFNIGVFQEEIFKDITGVAGENVIVYCGGSVENAASRFIVGRKPVCPKFIIANSANGVQISLHNAELGIDVSRLFTQGTTVDPRFILSNLSGANDVYLVLNGEGKVSVDFRSGGL